MIARTGGRTLLAALALTLVTVTGCSEQDAQDAVDQARDQVSSAVEDADLPEVNWQQYSGELQDRLEELASNADCEGLRRELAKVEADDTELTRYIKSQLRNAGC